MQNLRLMVRKVFLNQTWSLQGCAMGILFEYYLNFGKP